MADASEPALQECSSCGQMLDTTEEQPLSLARCPGCGAKNRVRQRFNHFELEEVLGAGGMGAVYRALDLNLGRPVALKLLRHEHSRDPELIASFAKEAAITASINHPYVVKVYSTGTDHGVFYIAMELVDKGSLDELMEQKGRIGELQLLEVGIQVAKGLNAACERGLIHRDVKPGNILFASAEIAKIVDFGLAVLQEQANAEGGAIWGTPYYVAPEKLDTPPREDFRSDIYSLGATLFHAAAGRPPFEADTASMSELRVLKSQPVSLQAFAPEISDATAFIIQKMIHHSPERRYASYAELIQNLQYTRNELLAAQRASQRAALQGRDYGGWIAMAALAALLGGGAFFLLHRDGSSGKPDPAAPTRQALAVAADPFAAARAQILAGDYAPAAVALRGLDAEEPPAQPRHNWLAMNAALALLLDGRLAEGQKEFAKIAARGLYSPDPIEHKLAAFFLETARAAASDETIPGANATNYDPANHECFALLLLGVKDWQRGAFDDAGALFAQFAAAAPEGPNAWIASYQPIAAAFSADLAAYRKISGNKPREMADCEKAIEEVKAIRARQKSAGKFSEKLDALAARLGEQLSTAQTAAAKQATDAEAAEAKALAATIQRATTDFAVLNFRDAVSALTASHFTDEHRQAERDGWLKRAEWLARFKITLVNDINVTGYNQPLLRRSGTPIPLGLRKASETTAVMVTPYGEVPVPWGEISVDSFAKIAQAFIHSAPAEAVADREWSLGVFLYVFGKKADGLALLNLAAQAKPDLAPCLALFPEN